MEIGKILWEDHGELNRNGCKTKLNSHVFDWKGRIVKTLGIIGGGVVGRSLLFNLAQEASGFSRILLFEAADFCFPCTVHSTAVVAPRGVTRGHSSLGDLILEGVETFSQHAKRDLPAGVYPMIQFTGALTKIEAFKERYPFGQIRNQLSAIPLKTDIYFAEEEGFQIDPALYLDWLLNEAKKKLPLLKLDKFVTGIEKGDRISLTTQDEGVFEVDELVLATGAYSPYWKMLFPNSKLHTSRPVQGSYLEFTGRPLELPSLSITLDGHNLINHAASGKLLIGSTTSELSHSLAPIKELRKIYDFFNDYLKISLPLFEEGAVLVGHREKAQKRSPYVVSENNITCIGGLYKNGFSLSLKMTRNFSHQLRERA